MYVCKWAAQMWSCDRYFILIHIDFHFDLMLSVLEIFCIPILHTVGHQLKQHWHVNTAGRFFLASRQALSSSLITQGSPLLRSPCLFPHSLWISHSFLYLLVIIAWWYILLTLVSSALCTACSACHLCLLTICVCLSKCSSSWFAD